MSYIRHVRSSTPFLLNLRFSLLKTKSGEKSRSVILNLIEAIQFYTCLVFFTLTLVTCAFFCFVPLDETLLHTGKNIDHLCSLKATILYVMLVVIETSDYITVEAFLTVQLVSGQRTRWLLISSLEEIVVNLSLVFCSV